MYTGGPRARGERARELFELADRQAGYFTARQAGELGYSRRAQHHHRDRGTWLSAGHGLFRLRDYPHGEDEDLVRLSLWSSDRRGEPQAVVSHDTALRLYDLSDLMPARLHLTVPRAFRKAPPPGVVLHKAEVPPADVEERAGYKVTRPTRTLVDLAASGLSPEHLGSAVLQALDRGLTRRSTLAASLEWLDGAARERLARALETS